MFKNMETSRYLKDGINQQHQRELPSFRTRHFIILFTLMIMCVLFSIGFYMNIHDRQCVIHEPRTTPSSHTNYTLDIGKNDRKYDKHGNAANAPVVYNDVVNMKSNSSDQTLNRTGKYKKRLPECLIIGVKKGGTGALLHFMNIHPNIVCYLKEGSFFSRDENFNRGLEYYRNQMPFSYPDQITVEKTPGYFIKEIAVKRIQAFNKNIKVILTLRHPIKRLISDYEHEKRANREPEIGKRFEELAINETGGINLHYMPIKKSMYYRYLHMWLNYFPKKQIHIVDGDNFIENPVEEVEKIETFLGLPHKVTKDKVFFNQTKGFYCYVDGNKTECMVRGKGHVFNSIQPDLYHKLYDFYKDYNEKLFALLGRTFKWDKEY